MSQKDKLIKRLRSKSKDFTFDEMDTLLKSLGFETYNKGKTSGSRVMYSNKSGLNIIMHKPHPNKEVKGYQLKQILQLLEEEKLI